MSTILQDLRYALRQFRRSPGITAVVVISLALAIGANTAIFSLIDAILLQSLPVTRPHELYFLAQGDRAGRQMNSNYPLFERYHDLPVFSGVTAFRAVTMKVTLGGTSEFVEGQYVSGNYHAVVGPSFVLGRGFTTESDRSPDQEAVAVISEGYWMRRFGGAPDVLGRTLTIQDRPVSIVGVTSAEFGGLVPGTPVDITLPLSTYVLDRPAFLDMHDGFTSMPIVGRLRPNVSEEQAIAVVDAAFQRFMSEPENRWARDGSPQDYAAARLQPAGKGLDVLRSQYRTPLLILMGMAGLVLLIASANVANLLLARSAARAKEVAIRISVGSGRWRVIRQFVAEGVLLALAGGTLGVLLATWGADVIVAMFGSWQRPIVIDVSPNLRVLAFTAATALTTGMAFGLAPALRVTRADLAPVLKGSGPGNRTTVGRGLAGRGLIVAQVALSVVVIAVAALFTQSVRNLTTQDAGFDSANVLLFDLDPSSTPFAQAHAESLPVDLTERLKSLPGVTSASMSTLTPIHPAVNVRGLALSGLPETEEARGATLNLVTAEYFQTMGTRMLQGRAFTSLDISGAQKVGVVNERTARYVFGDADPIGRTISWMGAPDELIEIVGVVEDTHQASLWEDAPRMVYMPLTQLPGRVQVAIRTSRDPAAIAGLVRDVVHDVSPGVVVDHVRTMKQQIGDSLVRERALTWLSAGFALLALLLACVGLYGVMLHSVMARVREIGIRMALGARRSRVLGAVLRDALVTSAAGVVLGTMVTLYATRVVSTLLFGLSPRDPLILGGVGAFLLGVALVVAYLPARRAAQVDPMVAFRSE